MKLADYLYFNKITIKDLAEQLGYSRNHLSLIVNDKGFPSPRLAKDIEKITQGKVKASSWKNAKRKKDNGKD